MKNRMISFFSILLLIILTGIVLVSCGSNTPPPPGSSNGSISANSGPDGQALMLARCSVCHSTDRVTGSHKTAQQWQITVDRMINSGAQLTPQEEQILVDYLAQNYK